MNNLYDDLVKESGSDVSFNLAYSLAAILTARNYVCTVMTAC